jgi:hypothetical protein
MAIKLLKIPINNKYGLNNERWFWWEASTAKLKKKA